MRAAYRPNSHRLGRRVFRVRLVGDFSPLHSRASVLPRRRDMGPGTAGRAPELRWSRGRATPRRPDRSPARNRLAAHRFDQGLTRLLPSPGQQEKDPAVALHPRHQNPSVVDNNGLGRVAKTICHGGYAIPARRLGQDRRQRRNTSRGGRWPSGAAQGRRGRVRLPPPGWATMATEVGTRIP